MDRKEQVLGTRRTVDGWVQRARTLEEPQKGSELETDDKIWPARRVSETSRLALVASSEHLQLACQIVDGPRGYASATHTVLRSALLGAATSVWILAPDDRHERQQRALRQMREWYRRIEMYSQACRAHCPPGDLRALENQIEAAKEQAKSVRDLWEHTASITADEKPTDTKVIDWVAGYLFPSDLAKATTIRRDWAAHSGDAHALGWQLVARRTAPMTRNSSGFRVTAAKAGIEHVADPYLAAFVVLKRGWSLFDQRCSEK